MMVRLAREIVRRSAWLAPRDVRARWREEWLGEIEASIERASPTSPRARRTPLRLVTRAAGAPIDAALLRLAVFDRSFFMAWGSDLRDGLREWRRTPVRTATAALCLTAGLAASLVAFAVVNYWIGGDLAGLRDRSTLARLVVMRGSDRLNPSVEEFRALAAAPLTSVGLAASTRARHLALVEGRTLSVETQAVSSGFFHELGTTASTGRLLHEADSRPDAPPAVVVSHALWQGALGGRTDVVGLRLTLASPGSSLPARAYTVAGVTPRGFSGVEIRNIRTSADRPVVWIPMPHAPPDSGLDRMDFLTVVGRLAAPERVAVAELDGRLRSSGAMPELPAGSVALLPFLAAPVTDPMEVVLTGAMFLSVPLALVLIVCVNVAGLRLAGTAARTHELAVRASLGASRARLVRLLSTEAVVLACVSTLAAWGVAIALGRWVSTFIALATPDWRSLAFAATVAVGIPILAGVIPALRVTGPRTLPALAAGSPSVAGSRLRGFRWLTTVQMALSLALLLSGALGVRAVQNLSTDRFDVASVATADVTLTTPGLGPAQRSSVLAMAQRHIATFPGVESTALSTMGTFNVGTARYNVERGSRPRDLPRNASVGVHGGMVSASFFHAVGFRILEGRTFTDADGPAVAVVTEAFRRWLPADRPVVGTRLREVIVRGTKRDDVDIVGVVTDGISLAELRHPTARTPTIFLPLGADLPADVTLFARSPVPDDTARRLADLAVPGAALLVHRASTLQNALERQRQPIVLIARVLGGTAMVALIVSAMGLWGVATAGVARRRREFGVRLAMGATPGSVARLLLRDSGRVSVLGAMIGLAIMTPILIAMQGEMAVDAWDPPALLLSMSVLAGAALAATIGPALRASRVDPLEILRAE